MKNQNRSGKLSSQIEALELLQVHFRNAGRFGRFNRTIKGEEVTAEKVWLGDVLGLWTKPATYWLSKKSELEKSLRPYVSKNIEEPVSDWYLINDYQCGDFVERHTKGILKQIAMLKAIA